MFMGFEFLANPIYEWIAKAKNIRSKEDRNNCSRRVFDVALSKKLEMMVSRTNDLHKCVLCINVRLGVAIRE